MNLSRVFSHVANTVSDATGKPLAFCLCVLAVVTWAVSGPIFGFSDTWQLVINTGTTIITFLMVFLIQNTQNRENSAIQAKLDEIILATRGAKNRMIGIEHLTDEELKALVDEAERRAKRPPAQRTRSGKSAAGARAASRKAVARTKAKPA